MGTLKFFNSHNKNELKETGVKNILFFQHIWNIIISTSNKHKIKIFYTLFFFLSVSNLVRIICFQRILI